MTGCKNCGDELFKSVSEQEPTDATDSGFCSVRCHDDYEQYAYLQCQLEPELDVLACCDDAAYRTGLCDCA